MKKNNIKIIIRAFLKHSLKRNNLHHIYLFIIFLFIASFVVQCTKRVVTELNLRDERWNQIIGTWHKRDGEASTYNGVTSLKYVDYKLKFKHDSTYSISIWEYQPTVGNFLIKADSLFLISHEDSEEIYKINVENNILNISVLDNKNYVVRLFLIGTWRKKD